MLHQTKRAGQHSVAKVAQQITHSKHIIFKIDLINLFVTSSSECIKLHHKASYKHFFLLPSLLYEFITTETHVF